jgi:[amino group carrier protein]-lysine/ornithine hydrolase
MDHFDTLVGLVERYSPSGQEGEAVEYLIKRMQTLGFDETFIDGAGNAIGVMGSGPRQVILLGHIDTVPGEIKIALTPDPSPGGRGELLYGRGAVDAKGPLACFVDAVAQVGSIEGWQFMVIAAVDEERDSEGARFIAGKYRPEFAIVGEPNHWDRLALGYKGSAWAEITVRREQAHTASGEQTAAEAAVEAWAAIKAYADAYNAGKQRAFDQILPTLRRLDTGEDAFEQWAQLRIGVRLPVELNPDDWYRELQKTLKVLGKHPRSDAKGDETFRVSLERLGYPVPAWKCEKNSSLVRAFLNGIRLVGGTPRFVYKTGTADLNVVAPAWQCPAVVYGPGDSSLDHTPNEHLSLEEYKMSVNVVAAALRRLAES